MEVWVNIEHDLNTVWATIRLRAQEWKNGTPYRDYTEAGGTSEHLVLWTNFEEKYEVAAILSVTTDHHVYIDESHEPSGRIAGNGTLVNSYEFIGDTGGDEAGTRTKVIVNFNKIKVRLRPKAGAVQ